MITEDQMDRLAAFAHDLVDELCETDRSLTYENQDYATATWPSWEDQAQRHVEVCTLAGEMRLRHIWQNIALMFHNPKQVPLRDWRTSPCHGCQGRLDDNVAFGPPIELADGAKYCSAACAWKLLTKLIREENAHA